MTQVSTNREINEHYRVLLCKTLKSCHDKNEIADWQMLGSSVALDFLGEDKGKKFLVSGAIKRCRKEYGCDFASVSGVGYRPIPQGDAAIEIGSHARHKIQRSTLQWRIRHEAIPLESLDTPERVNSYGRESLRLMSQEEENSARRAAQIQAPLERHEALTKERMNQILKEASETLSHVS